MNGYSGSADAVVADLLERVEHRYYGKYRGIVVDNADPEQLGRLRLQVPSILGDAVITGWATACVPYGGNPNQGFLFVPDVGAGVWVEFEEGDLEFPIWVGTYWSKPAGESELPHINTEDGEDEGSVQSPPTRKIIKTARGHTIQFEDAEGNESITIVEAHKGHVILLDAAGITLTHGAQETVITLEQEAITVTSGKSSESTITLNAEGVKVQSEKTVMISAKEKISLEADTIDIVATTGKLKATGHPIHLNP